MAPKDNSPAHMTALGQRGGEATHTKYGGSHFAELGRKPKRKKRRPSVATKPPAKANRTRDLPPTAPPATASALATIDAILADIGTA